MPCNCGKNKARFQVKNAQDKTVFVTSVRGTADAVARKYTGGYVVEVGPKP